MTKEENNESISLLDATLRDILSILQDEDNRIVIGKEGGDYLSPDQELKLLRAAVDAHFQIENLAVDLDLVIER